MDRMMDNDDPKPTRPRKARAEVCLFCEKKVTEHATC